MRQTHVAGEKLFVDFAGDTVPVTASGDRRRTTSSTSSSPPSEPPTTRMRRRDGRKGWPTGSACTSTRWVRSAAVPKAVVCDNLKAGVTKASRYEPSINRTYQELATHYGFAVLPTRVRKPRTRPRSSCRPHCREICAGEAAEPALLLVEDRMPQSAECVADLNSKIMRKLWKSRRELLETIERPALKALPAGSIRYVAQWKRCRVAPDYHVEIAGHFYSVPSRLIRLRWSRRASLTPPSRYSTAAPASPATHSRPSRTGTPRSRNICRVRTGATPSGTPARLRMREAERGRERQRSLRCPAIMRASGIPNKGTALASAFCGSPRDMASIGSMPPAGAAMASALAATAPSLRS